MAAQHLTALASPEFPQVFDAIINRLYEQVERVLAANTPPQPYFHSINWEGVNRG